MARSLRGIEAAASMLVAETGDDCSDTALIVGNYLHSFSAEAIVTMAANADELLDRTKDQTLAANKAG